MKWSECLEKWSISGLSINAGFLTMDWAPNEQDKICAWQMYVELLTRITTQPLDDEHGDEKTALTSIYSLFATTRDILKTDGRQCKEFTKISIIVLNQKVRPFTAKWHKNSVAGELNGSDDAKRNQLVCDEFRTELAELQQVLAQYTKLLADMAGVEDLTMMEQ